MTYRHCLLLTFFALLLSCYVTATQATGYNTIVASRFSVEEVDAFIIQYYLDAPWVPYHHHVCYRYSENTYYCLIYKNPTTTMGNHYVKLHCPAPTWQNLTVSNPYCPDTVVSDKNLGNDSLTSTCKSCVANPINPATGNKYQSELDYAGSGPYPLEFQRYYNSDPSVASTRMGLHWRGSFDGVIVAMDSLTRRTHRPNGRVWEFRYYSGRWNTDPDVPVRLDEVKDTQGVTTGWRLTLTDDSVEDYDLNGRLVAVTRRDGLAQTLDYAAPASAGGDDNPATLDRVTDPFGRTLTLHYDANERIATLTDPAGGVYIYGYDALDNLSSVTYPDETPGNESDNPVRLYHYEDQNFPQALTGVTDENGARYATWAYDSQGRAITSEHAGGADRVDLVYQSDGTATVTDAQGQAQHYQFHIDHGLVQIAQIDDGPCSACGERSHALTYDANGFIASRTDFNGNVTAYFHDTRGLQTARTEAVGTAEERTITTIWHPDFRLPTQITAPGQITTFTYDAAGRLLTREVLAQ